MKVLYVSLGIGGHDLRFLRLFGAAGFTTACFVPSGLPVAPQLPAGADLVRADTLSAAIAQERPDLIVAGPIPDNGYLAASSGFTPLVLLSWGFDLLRDVQRDAAAAQRAAAALRAAQWLVCDCEAARLEAVTRFGFPQSRCLMVPWGLERETFALAGNDEGLRRSLGWESQFVVVSARSLF